jgi:hypothetical protein
MTGSSNDSPNPSPRRDYLTPALAVVAAAAVLCFLILLIRPQTLGLHRHAPNAAVQTPSEPPFATQLAIADGTVAALSLKDAGHIDEAIRALEALVATYPSGGRYLAEPYLSLGWCYRKKEVLAEAAGNAAEADAARQYALWYFDLTARTAPPTVQEAIDARQAAERIRAELGP